MEKHSKIQIYFPFPSKNSLEILRQKNDFYDKIEFFVTKDFDSDHKFYVEEDFEQILKIAENCRKVEFSVQNFNFENFLSNLEKDENLIKSYNFYSEIFNIFSENSKNSEKFYAKNLKIVNFNNFLSIPNSSTSKAQIFGKFISSKKIEKIAINSSEFNNFNDLILSKISEYFLTKIFEEKENFSGEILEKIQKNGLFSMKILENNFKTLKISNEFFCEDFSNVFFPLKNQDFLDKVAFFNFLIFSGQKIITLPIFSNFNNFFSGFLFLENLIFSEKFDEKIIFSVLKFPLKKFKVKNFEIENFENLKFISLNFQKIYFLKNVDFLEFYDNFYQSFLIESDFLTEKILISLTEDFWKIYKICEIYEKIAQVFSENLLKNLANLSEFSIYFENLPENWKLLKIKKLNLVFHEKIFLLLEIFEKIEISEFENIKNSKIEEKYFSKFYEIYAKIQQFCIKMHKFDDFVEFSPEF